MAPVLVDTDILKTILGYDSLSAARIDAIQMEILLLQKVTIMRGDRNEQLNILPEAKKVPLYGLPIVDDFQRIEIFCANRC